MARRLSRTLRPRRIAVTSDLHLDKAGRLTPRAAIDALVADIEKAKPDAVILGGDLADGLDAFEECVAAFVRLDVPVGVIAGNHDLWRDNERQMGSERLWGGELRAATERQKGVWLEANALRLRDVAVVGSIAWYDYSAVDPLAGVGEEQLKALKRFVNADAHRMDWLRDDRDFAAEVGAGFLGRLDAMAGRPDVRTVLAVTHVPLLEEQVWRKPGDLAWGTSNAYFGNLTLGEEVMKRPKLGALVSGHTHHACHADVDRDDLPPVKTWVVGSDYGAPAFLLVEL